MKVRSIKTTFTEGKFLYTQMARNGKWAVYKQEKLGHLTSWEVVRIKESTIHPYDPNPEEWDKVEVYPRPEHWGSDGITLPARDGLDGAIARMNEAVADDALKAREI